jgi:multidrug efflux system membrane fusion protein
MRVLNPKLFGSFFALRIDLLVWISALLAACSSGTKGEQSPQKTVPVTVGSVIQKDVPLQLRAIGTVEAYSVVTIKCQVGGELTRVYFAEGQEVTKGDLLFTIDPRPFEAALKEVEAKLEKDLAQVKQAKANLERDTALAENARAELRRYEYLIEKGVVARQQYDKFRTDAEALEATVRADRAAVENAEATVLADKASAENTKVQLGYCFIRSPIDGRTGGLIVQQGNIVKANDVNLVVINQITPIYVTFSVPEENLPEIMRYMGVGKLKVEATLPNDEKRPDQGILTFVDNAVDTATGTIRLKGTFKNKEKRLWPGQFVNVVLTLAIKPNAIVVPSQAIQAGQEGQYVFLVKPDQTVESRPVVVERTLNDETIVQKGLNPGETVVTDGQIRLRPGVKVEIKTSSSTFGKSP